MPPRKRAPEKGAGEGTERRASDLTGHGRVPSLPSRPVPFCVAVTREWENLMRARVERDSRERTEELRARAERMIPGIERSIQFREERGLPVPEAVRKRLEWLRNETKS